ncbi:MAG: hypothetical protein HUU20_13090 [Pirellulales bacterium]|nr:hypothetical protein [Pirellulales bacterium]
MSEVSAGSYNGFRYFAPLGSPLDGAESGFSGPIIDCKLAGARQSAARMPEISPEIGRITGRRPWISEEEHHP